MKTVRFFAMASVAIASLLLMAQRVSAISEQESGSAKDVYTTQGQTGFGDEASSHAYEMSSVRGELEGKLNSKTAKVGDRVILKTTEKVQTADGTVIPKGARLVGRITEVQAHDSAHAISQLGIAFDRAELKNGQSIAIYSLIRRVSPGPSAAATGSVNTDNPSGAIANASMSGMGNSNARGNRSGGGLLDSAASLSSGTLQRTTATTSSVGEQTGANANPDVGGAVQLAGHGDLNDQIGAHQQAAARAVPHPTEISGVMLAGSSSASGMFFASEKDVEFESGTQMQLGIVADR